MPEILDACCGMQFKFSAETEEEAEKHKEEIQNGIDGRYRFCYVKKLECGEL